jgi:DNA-binding NtrC family response regulator
VSARPVVLIGRELEPSRKSLVERLDGEGSAGVEVIPFDTPEEGIRLLSGRQVDLVVLRVDGRGEHRSLLALAQQSTPQVPVIGALPPGVAEPAGRAGAAFVEVLPEPLDPARLARASRNALRLRGLSGQLHEKETELNTLEEIGRTIISSLELQTVLNIIMEKTRELVKAESWSLLLGEEGEGGLSLSVAVGEAPPPDRTAAVIKPGRASPAGSRARQASGRPRRRRRPALCGLEEAYGGGALGAAASRSRRAGGCSASSRS